MAFVEGFTIGTRLRQARENALRQEALEKERIKLLQQRLKGAQADRELKEAQLSVQLADRQRQITGQQALGRAVALGGPGAQQRVPSLPQAAATTPFDPSQARQQAQRTALGEAVGAGVPITPQVAAFIQPRRTKGPTINDNMVRLRAAGVNVPGLENVSVEQAQAVQDQLVRSRRAGATQVNVGQDGRPYGDPPKDMVWARDAQGQIQLTRDPKTGAFAPVAIPIPGSKPALEAEERVAKGEATKRQAEMTGNIVVERINRVLGLLQSAALPTTGLLGEAFSRIGGTAASDIARNLDTIEANIAFDALQQMRAASPTGGALGAITERELELLSSTMGSLRQSQTRDQFLFNLTTIHDQFLDTVHGPGQGPPRLRGAAPAPQTPQPQQRTFLFRGEQLALNDVTQDMIDNMTREELDAFEAFLDQRRP